jgi:hypothetical protein
LDTGGTTRLTVANGGAVAIALRLNIAGAADAVGVPLHVAGHCVLDNSGTYYNFGFGLLGATNTEFAAIAHDGTRLRIRADRDGTGSYRPIQFETSGILRLTIQTSGTVTCSGSVETSLQLIAYNSGGGNSAGLICLAGSPAMTLSNTGGSADNKTWDVIINSQVKQFRLVNDANNSATNWLTATRSGMTVSRVDFPAAAPVVMANDLVFGAAGATIRSDTADASDTKAITITGGGNGAVSRGALLTLYGNEWGGANSGRVQLASGTGSPGDIQILTGSTLRLGITSAGVYTLSGLSGSVTTTVTVTSTGQLGRTAALAVNDGTGQVIATTSGSDLNAGFVSESTLPYMAWHETDAAANQGWWAMGAQTNQFRLVTINDAGSTVNNIMAVDRTGVTPTLITFPPAVSVGEKLTTAAPTAARAGFRLVPGTIPTTPVDGDMWYDAADNRIKVRINGVTRRFQDLPA